jgi:hypothetical protein
MKEYFERPQDVINAVRSLGNSGLSVSLPNRSANGEMSFKVEGRYLSVAQILELWDRNELHLGGIRQFDSKQQKQAASCGS